jgi:penicillin-binding protein 2
LIGRDIMTWLFDRDRAIASLAEAEPTWGGDIRTRMAAESAAYRAANAPKPAAVQTELGAPAPTDAPAVRAAAAADAAAAEALANSAAAGNTVAESGSTEHDLE